MDLSFFYTGQFAKYASAAGIVGLATGSFSGHKWLKWVAAGTAVLYVLNSNPNA